MDERWARVTGAGAGAWEVVQDHIGLSKAACFVYQ